MKEQEAIKLFRRIGDIPHDGFFDKLSFITTSVAMKEALEIALATLEKQYPSAEQEPQFNIRKPYDPNEFFSAERKEKKWDSGFYRTHGLRAR